MAASDWTGYAAAVSFWPNALYTVGFRYGPDGATPTYVGGAFHQHLRDYRSEQTSAAGPAGAALLRVVSPGQPVEVRLVYPPASDQITWQAPDGELAQRLAPPGMPSAAIVPRAEPDLLEPAALLARVAADVAASLRARDGWASYALAFDVASQQSTAFIYTDAGAEPYQLSLSVFADLAELRDQTARPDGTQWVGVLVQSWSGSDRMSQSGSDRMSQSGSDRMSQSGSDRTSQSGSDHVSPSGSDRVDLSFWSQAGITAFLSDAANGAGLRMRPPAQPPAEAPVVPWPPTGGHLDHERLLDAVTDHVGHSPDLAGNDWDRVAILVSFDGSSPTIRGLRYLGTDGPVADTPIGDAGPIGKLRRSMRAANGRLPGAYVLSAYRGARRLDVRAYFGQEAADLVALPTGPLIDRLRPA